jgi:hypothetical protein
LGGHLLDGLEQSIGVALRAEGLGEVGGNLFGGRFSHIVAGRYFFGSGGLAGQVLRHEGREAAGHGGSDEGYGAAEGEVHDSKDSSFIKSIFSALTRGFLPSGHWTEKSDEG